MTPFLKSIADYLFNEYADNLYQIAVVFPNKRARLYFNQYLSKKASKPVFAPKYFTITEFMQQLSGNPIADQLTLLFYMYEVYINVTGSNQSFDDFIFYCEMLLADFDDVDKYLIDANDLYTNISDLKDIENYFDYLEESQVNAIKRFWNTFKESKDSNEKEKFDSLWNVLLKIYKNFNELLSERNLEYEGSAYRKAINNLDINKIKYKKVVFVGFNALNTCEKKLFQYLKRHKRGVFFWDYDNYYINSKFNEAAYFLRDLIKEFPVPIGFECSRDNLIKNKKIKIYDIPTNTGQAMSLSMALDELDKDWQNSPVKTAIALADESLLIPVINSLPNDIKEVNISMGYPLKETQTYNLTNNLLNLQVNKRIRKEGSCEFYYKDVNKILNNGVFIELINVDIIQFQKEIIKKNLIYVSSNDLQKIGGVFTLIFKVNIEANNFAEYLLELLEITSQLYNKESSNWQIETEANYRIATQLKRLIDILKETKVSYTFKSLIRLIGKILQGTTIPFSGEPLSGMQVMGVLETRTLDFDNLIVLSMNEGIFPKSGNVPSLIPYILRKSFGMPTIEHQDAIFAYYFYRLMQRAQTVILMYSSSVSDMKTGEPSRFIQQLVFDNKFNISKQTIAYKVLPVTKRNIEIQRNIETYNILYNKYIKTNNVISPSAINTYLNCQIKFFYKYIGGIKEPEELLEEVESNTLGSILHAAMEELYTPLKNNPIKSKEIKTLLKKKDHISQIVSKAFWHEFISPGTKFPETGKVEWQGKNILIHNVITKYIERILKFDASYEEFKILSLEEDFGINYTLNNNDMVRIGGRIDRIDLVENQYRIVDYKTGAVKNSFENIDALFYGDPLKRNDAAFQALLYSYVVSKNKGYENIQPVLYFVRNLTPANPQIAIQTGGNRAKSYLSDFNVVKNEFLKELNMVVNEIFQKTGFYEPTKNEDYCNFCVYKNICGK